MLTHFLPFLIAVVMTSFVAGVFMRGRSAGKDVAVPFGALVLCLLITFFDMLNCFFPLR